MAAQDIQEMSAINRIALLGFGEVGSRFAAALSANSKLELQAWDRLFTSPDSKPNSNLQRLSQIRPATHAAAAALDCQLVISAVTAEQNLAATLSVLPGLPKQAWFVDFNSVSPGSKRAVAAAVTEAGGRYVEVVIMSPIDPQGSQSPMLCGGPHAVAFLPIAKSLGFTAMQFCSAELGQAAATKMCRSVVVKGMETLLTEALLTARHYGVEVGVLASLANLLPRPDWQQHAAYMISRSLLHGTRRAEEMREAAHTVAEAGIEPRMSSACAEGQDWAAQFPSVLQQTELNALLDALNLASSKHKQTNEFPDYPDKVNSA